MGKMANGARDILVRQESKITVFYSLLQMGDHGKQSLKYVLYFKEASHRFQTQE